MPDPAHPQLLRYIRRAAEGMQRPPIFEADDGHDYVLKLDIEDPDFPAAELVAAGLAVGLNVPLPAYRVLTAPDALIDALHSTADAELRAFAESFARQGGACFGSRYLTGVTVKWDPALRRRVEAADATLVGLLVFDAYIENGDRSAAHNPNLLVSSGRLYAIDHGQSLPSVQGITSKIRPYPFDSHLGWSFVVEQPHLLDAPLNDLASLADATIDAAIEAVPPRWWQAPDRPDRARQALRERRDRLPAMIRQILETLR